VAVVAAAVVAQLIVLALVRLTAATADGGDLCQDTAAIQRILHGQPAYAPTTGCGTLVNLPHPPASLLLVGPVALLPIPLAAVVWDMVLLGAVAATVAFALREVGARPTPWRLAALLVLLVCWPPLLDTLLEVQIGPVLLLLSMLAWRWGRRGRMGWAGVAVGVAAALRLFPALAVVYFVARREWRALAGASAAFVVSETLALPLVGVKGFVDYATRALPGTQAQFGNTADNLSLWGWAAQLAPGAARPLALALVAGMVVVLVVVTVRRRRRHLHADDATFLAYLPAMVLASPLAWSFYLVLTLLPLVVAATYLGWLGPSAASAADTFETAARDRWRRWSTSGLVVGALALVWLDRVAPARSILSSYGLPATLSTYALALLIIALFVLSARDQGGDGPLADLGGEMQMTQSA
jgi:alpha-1,2-mannosyltransferase